SLSYLFNEDSKLNIHNSSVGAEGMNVQIGTIRSIVGVFDDQEGANRALEQLGGEGLGPDDVSLMMRDVPNVGDQERQYPSPVAGGAAAGAAIGGLLGGLRSGGGRGGEG